MKKVFFAVTLITATIVALILTLRFTHPEWKANLVSPGFPLGATTQKSEAEPSATPNMKAPKVFQFDETTDLKAELEKINPEILDSDFE